MNDKIINEMETIPNKQARGNSGKEQLPEEDQHEEETLRGKKKTFHNCDEKVLLSNQVLTQSLFFIYNL